MKDIEITLRLSVDFEKYRAGYRLEEVSDERILEYIEQDAVQALRGVEWKCSIDHRGSLNRPYIDSSARITG